MHSMQRQHVLAYLEANYTPSKQAVTYRLHADMVSSVFRQKQKELHAAERSLADLRLRYERMKMKVMHLREEVENAEKARLNYSLNLDEADWMRRQEELSTFTP
ncbi:hypothetical protein [Paracoccus lutimaris]|nr:hypothetical protein [Paracoccus lutimaris]